MASLVGGRYAFFAPGESVNVVITSNGGNLPPPIAGQFNLEVVTSLNGPTVLPSGYQGVALMAPDGRTLDLVTGDFGVRDSGNNGGADTIVAGAGNETIIGGRLTASIVGGSGATSIDASGSGGATIRAGSGPETIRGGGHGSIIGGSGPATIIGGVGDTIGGSSGAISVDGSAGREQITAGTGPATIIAGQRDTVTGGQGNTTIDLAGGPTTVNLRAGVETVVDTGIKSSVTVTGFNQVAGDRISFAGETPAAIQHVVATARSSGLQTVIAFPDGTTMTLIGVSHITTGFFT